MKPVKYGVIGVGGMGGSHCSALAEMPETELTAVADVNEATAQEVGEKYGAAPFSDWKAMIRKGGIEAVMIATPHYFHPPMAEYAARHGVHVLSEKPIAVSVKAADKMVATCREAGVLLGVMFQQRTEPLRLKMHDLIHEGALGAIHRVSIQAPWYRSQKYYDGGAWRGTWKGEGGGILMNQAPHTVDQFIWLGGTPKTVQAVATTRLHKIEVENTAMAVCDYGDGKLGYFYASTAEVPTGERVEVVGENGALILGDGQLRHFECELPVNKHIFIAERFEAPKGEWTTIEPEDLPRGHREVHRRFAHAVRENDESLMIATGEDGIKALELANAILMAGYTHREVSLPLNRGKFESMLKKLQNGAKPEEFNRG